MHLLFSILQIVFETKKHFFTFSGSFLVRSKSKRSSESRRPLVTLRYSQRLRVGNFCFQRWKRQKKRRRTHPKCRNTFAFCFCKEYEVWRKIGKFRLGLHVATPVALNCGPHPQTKLQCCSLCPTRVLPKQELKNEVNAFLRGNAIFKNENRLSIVWGSFWLFFCSDFIGHFLKRREKKIRKWYEAQ